jgi:hypothetical protein
MPCHAIQFLSCITLSCILRAEPRNHAIGQVTAVEGRAVGEGRPSGEERSAEGGRPAGDGPEGQAAGPVQAPDKSNMPVTTHPGTKCLVSSGAIHSQKPVPTPQQVKHVLCAAVSQAAITAMLVVIAATEQVKEHMASVPSVKVLAQDLAGSPRRILGSRTW